MSSSSNSKWSKAKDLLKGLKPSALIIPSNGHNSSASSDGHNSSYFSLFNRSKSFTKKKNTKISSSSSSSSKWSKAKELLKGLKVILPSDGQKSPASSDGQNSSYFSLFSHSKSFPKMPSKKTCSICLATMERGDRHAIFTAECSHSFHFHCIASNVKHGNRVCPICRAKWKEIPFEGPTLEPSLRERQRVVSPSEGALMTVIRRPPISPRIRHTIPSPPQAHEPAIFNDDECLDHQVKLTSPTSLDSPIATNNRFSREVKIETYSEFPAVPRTQWRDDFTVLVHVKAPVSLTLEENASMPYHLQTTRAPIDLVTVLDISGSMVGPKLILVKRAMGFVIQNLSSGDRLSIVTFSSTAHRLFPLRRMTELGKQQSLQALESFTASGGTNIAEGLRKGMKVMEDRRESNPVASIILLSDGQDTCTFASSNGSPKNYYLLLPQSIYGNSSSASKIPVHTFGFGTDHDASLMHSIADISGGTFSFIETEAVIQDAFAQCIGGLLSVVAKDLQVTVECIHPDLSVNSVRAGSYNSNITADRRTSLIKVGELYAEEEKDFLISVTVPVEDTMTETSLLKVKCVYTDTLRKKTVTVDGVEVIIQRPEVVPQEMLVSIEVDRQRNRLEAAEVMAQAKTKAEQGDLGGAASILDSFRKALALSVSGKCNDKLCIVLDAELKEMEERVGSRHIYEASGRAYILSGLSSHSWQRATARGDSTSGSSLVKSYQTVSMATMVGRSQASTSATQRNVSAPRSR